MQQLFGFTFGNTENSLCVKEDFGPKAASNISGAKDGGGSWRGSS